MRISVVLTTYNSPLWLEKVLCGYEQQTHGDFEVVIGDDGSTRETAELIERLRAGTRLDIQHVWQRDDGFRKCRILNKAILHARADYLVFTDGDCIPRRDFLAVHAARAEPGHYLSGSYYKLPMPLSQRISLDDIQSGRCFDIHWLWANGLPRGLKNLKLTANRWQARLLNATTPTRCNFKGSNGSAWRKDVLAVNGFNETMSWGGLDREFGVRLINAGVRPRHVRYDAVCIHLDHPRGYKNPDHVAANLRLRQHHARRGTVETDHGIRQLLASGYRPGVVAPLDDSSPLAV